MTGNVNQNLRPSFRFWESLGTRLAKRCWPIMEHSHSSVYHECTSSLGGSLTFISSVYHECTSSLGGSLTLIWLYFNIQKHYYIRWENSVVCHAGARKRGEESNTFHSNTWLETIRILLWIQTFKTVFVKCSCLIVWKTTAAPLCIIMVVTSGKQT